MLSLSRPTRAMVITYISLQFLSDVVLDDILDIKYQMSQSYILLRCSRSFSKLDCGTDL